MARNNKAELHKHTLNLRAGDYTYLDQVFGPSGVPAAVVIRQLISNHVDYLRSQEPPLDLPTESINV